MSGIFSKMKKNANDIYSDDEPLLDEEFSYEIVVNGINVVLYKSLASLISIISRSGYYTFRNSEEILQGFIQKPPVFDKRYYTEAMIPKYINNNLATINHFINVMEANFSKDQLQILYRNIKNLKIKQKKNMRGALGEYKERKNVILLLKDGSEKTTYHELFHLASTICTLGRTLVGLALLSDNLYLGRALTEGYTELLVNRYFDESIKSTSYYRELICAKCIEDIVGKGLMEDSYLTANVKELTDELIKYTTYKEIYEFFGKMDDVLVHSGRLLKDTSYDRIVANDIANNEIQINLWLVSLKQKKQQIYETVPYRDYEEYKKYFTVDGKEVGKNIYLELLSLYNCVDKKDDYYFGYELKDFMKLIGYDKLEDIVLNTGINGFIEELKKYMLEEDIPGYLEAYNEYLTPNMKYDDKKYIAVKRYHVGMMAAKYLYKKPIKIENDNKFIKFHYFFKEYLRDYYANISYFTRNKNNHLVTDYYGNEEDTDESHFYNAYVPHHGISNMSKVAKIIGYEELFWVLMLDDMNELIRVLSQYLDDYEIINLMEADKDSIERILKKFLNKINKTIERR